MRHILLSGAAALLAGPAFAGTVCDPKAPCFREKPPAPPVEVVTCASHGPWYCRPAGDRGAPLHVLFVSVEVGAYALATAWGSGSSGASVGRFGSGGGGSSSSGGASARAESTSTSSADVDVDVRVDVDVDGLPGTVDRPPAVVPLPAGLILLLSGLGLLSRFTWATARDQYGRERLRPYPNRADDMLLPEERIEELAAGEVAVAALLAKRRAR